MSEFRKTRKADHLIEMSHFFAALGSTSLRDAVPIHVPAVISLHVLLLGDGPGRGLPRVSPPLGSHLAHLWPHGGRRRDPGSGEIASRIMGTSSHVDHPNRHSGTPTTRNPCPPLLPQDATLWLVYLWSHGRRQEPTLPRSGGLHGLHGRRQRLFTKARKAADGR